MLTATEARQSWCAGTTQSQSLRWLVHDRTLSFFAVGCLLSRRSHQFASRASGVIQHAGAVLPLG